jgi:hypothetical protein
MEAVGAQPADKVLECFPLARHLERVVEKNMTIDGGQFSAATQHRSRPHVSETHSSSANPPTSSNHLVIFTRIASTYAMSMRGTEQ